MNIELSHCYYRYHHYIRGHEYALQDINLTIPSSQVIGLIGPNGAGKSTLIYLLAGLLKPFKGVILVDGIDLYKLKTFLADFRHSLSFVSQFPEDQFFTGSIYQELSFGLREQGLSEEVIHKRVTDCLRELDLDEKTMLNRSPYELGSGEKRLLCLAIALVRQPKMLILDEPTVGLDAASRCRVWNVLGKLSRMSDMSILLVSHELQRLASLANYLVLLHEGKIADQGSPREIFSRPRVLSDIGLRVPQIIDLGYELKKAGLQHEDWPIFEIEAAESVIKNWLKGP